MFKVDQLKRLFDCDLCNNLLIDPVTLPCGHTICRKHIRELLEKRSKAEAAFVCDLCGNEHVVPANGFLLNKKFKTALDIELNSLNIDMDVYNQCKKGVDEARENATKLESISKDPEYYLFKYFEEIKIKVDLRRENLKMDIDDFSDEIIKLIDIAQTNCVLRSTNGLSKELEQLSIDVEKLKKDLSQLISRFDTFDIREKKYEDIKQEVGVLNKAITRIQSEYTNSLLGNKEYSFESNHFEIKDVFGCFKEIQKLAPKFESTIVSLDQQNKLVDLCEFSKDQKWKLKYRASRDGFNSADFHSKCDAVENTLTIIKTTSGNVFGGYTEKAWSSLHEVRHIDPKSFIFSLINKENRPFKAQCDESIHVDDGYPRCYRNFPCFGPSFGSDIRILNNSNKNRDSFSEFEDWYKYPFGGLRLNSSNVILAGTPYFKTTEIEVFTKSET